MIDKKKKDTHAKYNRLDGRYRKGIFITSLGYWKIVYKEFKIKHPHIKEKHIFRICLINELCQNVHGDVHITRLMAAWGLKRPVTYYHINVLMNLGYIQRSRRGYYTLNRDGRMIIRYINVLYSNLLFEGNLGYIQCRDNKEKGSFIDFDI